MLKSNIPLENEMGQMSEKETCYIVYKMQVAQRSQEKNGRDPLRNDFLRSRVNITDIMERIRFLKRQ